MKMMMKTMKTMTTTAATMNPSAPTAVLRLLRCGDDLPRMNFYATPVAYSKWDDFLLSDPDFDLTRTTHTSVKNCTMLLDPSRCALIDHQRNRLQTQHPSLHAPIAELRLHLCGDATSKVCLYATLVVYSKFFWIPPKKIIVDEHTNSHLLYLCSLKLHQEKRPLSMKSDTIKKRHRYESDRLKKKGKRKAKKRQKLQKESAAQAVPAATTATATPLTAAAALTPPVQPQIATPDLCDGSCISGPGAFNF